MFDGNIRNDSNVLYCHKMKMVKLIIKMLVTSSY